MFKQKNRKNIPLRCKISCRIFSTIDGLVCLKNVFHLYIRTCVNTSYSGGTFLHFEFWPLSYIVSIFHFFHIHYLKWCNYLASYILCSFFLTLLLRVLDRFTCIVWKVLTFVLNVCTSIVTVVSVPEISKVYPQACLLLIGLHQTHYEITDPPHAWSTRRELSPLSQSFRKPWIIILLLFSAFMSYDSWQVGVTWN